MTTPIPALIALALALVPLNLTAQQPAVFTPVKDVCPTCAKPAQDIITLGDGRKVLARVVAENEDFFVVSRYGEVRAISKGGGMRIAWSNSRQPTGLTSQDQLVLSNGHVLTGAIVEQKDKPALIRLQSSVNQQTFIVFLDQVTAMYKDGRKVALAQ